MITVRLFEGIFQVFKKLIRSLSNESYVIKKKKTSIVFNELFSFVIDFEDEEVWEMLRLLDITTFIFKYLFMRYVLNRLKIYKRNWLSPKDYTRTTSHRSDVILE